MSDIDVLARTIFGEARGETYTGKIAIANVVLNRAALAMKHPHFGDGTITGACMVPWQFSCWNANDPNCQVINDVTDTDPIFADCLDIAELACNHKLDDMTGNATYYYAKGSPEPTWAVDKTPCAIIGNHLFFKDIA